MHYKISDLNQEQKQPISSVHVWEEAYEAKTRSSNAKFPG